MRLLFTLFACIALPAILLAQNGTVTGKIMSADIQIPLPNASVFLSNATFGTSSGTDGTFTMRNVKPGQYELVVTYVGYDTYYQTIMVGTGTLNLDIQMHLKSTTLNEVSIVRHPFSQENFNKFFKDFVGDSPNAKLCKVVNPRAMDLVYISVDKILAGHSDDFLTIENRALGYRVKYLINEFKSDYINYVISYEGKVLYEELKGSKSQMAKWRKKREEAYYGSNMHFLRSLKNNELDAQGFVIRQLIRKPNPERPPQLVVEHNIEKFYNQQNRDSLNYWKGLANLPKYKETLIRQPLKAEDIFRTTDQSGLYGFAFPDYLYVVYTKKRDNYAFNDLYRPLDMENFMTSIITLYKPYALFDSNGIVISPHTTLYEGAWSKDRIAEQLPVDYVPGTAEPVK
jgi:hypothetical protein